MCGFTAIVRTDGRRPDTRILERMTGVLHHRGPDDEGRFYCAGVALGFRRLSILDLSPSGHQPMSSEDGQATLVFNGEIYNYVELRAELEALGHRFRSTGDTEVLLNAYRQWGRECVERLRGMWAFAIYDHRRKVLFGSRDRFGMKPLYVARVPGHLLLASEIKAIRASGLYRHETSLQVAAAYLLEDRLDESTATFFSGIEAIAPATSFEVSVDGRLTQWRYWSLDKEPQPSVPDPAQALAERFEEAVRLHMRSDVPVGVNLSGGLDSTSIICASARIREAQGAKDPLMAFCYPAPEFDERSYIADTVDRTRAVLVDLATSPRALWDDFQQMLWHQDEPVHSMTAVIGYQLMRLAAQHGVKVVLNGQGADETIGGYPNYFRDYWHTLLSQGHAATTWREIRAHCSTHGGDAVSLFAAQARHLIQSALHAVAAYRRAAAARRQRRLRGASRWFDAELIGSATQDAERHHRTDLASVLRRSVELSPLPLYLRVEDRNAMAHSVEARLPFLDHRLVELVFALSADWHLRGPWNKFVLREAMRSRIPESVRTRPEKMGFPFPARQWFSGPLREPILDLLRSRSTRERGFYNVDALLRDAEDAPAGAGDLSNALFRVAQFELWASAAPVSSQHAMRPLDLVVS